MTQPANRDSDLRGDDPYAMWDAAYVLGSLSGHERREFEAHMATCPQCREAVAELSGIPALLIAILVCAATVTALAFGGSNLRLRIKPDGLPALSCEETSNWAGELKVGSGVGLAIDDDAWVLMPRAAMAAP